MTIKFVKKVMSVLLTLVLTAGMFATVAYADVTADYDSELVNVLANNCSPDLRFINNNDGTFANYNIVSAGKGMGWMYMDKFNERYNYVNFGSGNPFEIVSKSGFDISHGFKLEWEIFTNVPTTGSTEVCLGNLRFVTDYSNCTIYIYYKNDILAYLATGYEPGSNDFKMLYTFQEYTMNCIDGKITVSRLTDGVDWTNNKIIAYGNNIVWTLADGTESEEVPVPADANLGYSPLILKASKEIAKGVSGNVPKGFHSEYNGNGPLFSAFYLNTNCGFSTLQGYVDFVTSLSGSSDIEDVQFARNVYDSIQEVGSSGLKSAVAAYESYITAAEEAIWDATYSDYSVTSTDGGYVSCDGAEFVNDTAANPIKPGTVKTLTAVANAGYSFSHWADGKGAIVSYDKTFDLAFGLTTELKAVFTKDASASDDNITVIFRDHAGNTYSNISVPVGSEITLPQAPFAYGYTFTGWVIGGVEYAAGSSVKFTKDTVISAAFTKNDTTYAVTVSGSVNEISSNFAYNTLITAVFDRTKLKTGEQFVGWSNGTTVVSYDEEYSFFVGTSVDITALISRTAAEVTPLINMSNISIERDGKVASFLTERWLPSDCTFVESGMIYTNDIDCASKLTDENINGTSIRKATTKYHTNHGQFRLNLGSVSGAGTFYVAAYLSYKDANGNYNTIYTSVYSASTTAANA